MRMLAGQLYAHCLKLDVDVDAAELAKALDIFGTSKV
jgi:hypothetical protein